jgi:phosphoribosylamine---glycine ligase
MRVLIIGSGGREDALAWKIAQSPLVDDLFCIPGNAGTAQRAECVSLDPADFNAVSAFAGDQSIDLTVVGPEDPLARGIVDHFERKGLAVFGPSKAAAELEASKAFAKSLMQRQNIPTAAYAEFDRPDRAIAHVQRHGAPIVVKANGLAAGKGVTVARSVAEAEQAIGDAMETRVFGEAGAHVVIEEYLEGEEASILAFSDGARVLPMLTSQDHKPAYDDDQGPNTGGMGAYAPAPVVDAAMLAEIQQTILEPCVRGMAADNRPYKGVLYAGLIITPDGKPKVIEFNCRFGDPETQVVLPLMKTDLIPVMLACIHGTLADVSLEWHAGACASVVMASGGYPGAYQKGTPITGIHEAEERDGVVVFHAGTALRDGALVTNGGRVLNVTATGNDLAAAVQKAYTAVSTIRFAGAHYRSDIGKKGLNRRAG